MKKLVTAVLPGLTILLLIAALSCTGYAIPTSPTFNTPLSTQDVIPSLPTLYTPPGTQAVSDTPTMRVEITSTVLANGNEIHLKGTTDSMGVTMQSQLYDNLQPLNWWPTNQDIQANFYLWEMTVPLVANGNSYYLHPGTWYPLKFWKKDNPGHWGMSGIYISEQPTPTILLTP